MLSSCVWIGSAGTTSCSRVTGQGGAMFSVVKRFCYTPARMYWIELQYNIETETMCLDLLFICVNIYIWRSLCYPTRWTGSACTDSLVATCRQKTHMHIIYVPMSVSLLASNIYRRIHHVPESSQQSLTHQHLHPLTSLLPCAHVLAS